MSIEFLGHKKALLDFIVTIIVRESEGAPKIFADLFSGTGVVSAAFKKSGFKVIANDNLYLCKTFAEAILLNNYEPSFEKVVANLRKTSVNLLNPTPYDLVLDHLNSLEPISGFIHRNYSPTSIQISDYSRMYFTEENAGRIDAIRLEIEAWSDLLTPGERSLLISDLLKAANAVSNIAGTYGCYLKKWKKRAKARINLNRSPIIPSEINHKVYMEDANILAPQINGSIVYADPPYTKRQYAAYYHILETIAIGDEPLIQGSTGLRPWKDKSSAYCFKKNAHVALDDLISKLNFNHFFLSYNEDGQISHDTIMEILSNYGETSCFQTSYRRYKSSSRNHKGNNLKERLYHLRNSD